MSSLSLHVVFDAKGTYRTSSGSQSVGKEKSEIYP